MLQLIIHTGTEQREFSNIITKFEKNKKGFAFILLSIVNYTIISVKLNLCIDSINDHLF
jgi:hypothetical protein